MKNNKKIKEKIYFTIVATLIIVALLIPFVFAAIPENQVSKEKQFFSVDSVNKLAGSTLEMSVNLDEITYDNFIFTLENSNKESNIDTSEVENVELEEKDDSLVITGNKVNMNVNNIKLYYQIPKELTVGTTITFLATIEENIQEDKENSEEESGIIDNENQEVQDRQDDALSNEKEEKSNIDNSNNNQEAQYQKQTIEITITIVEEIEDDENEQNKQGQSLQTTGQQTASVQVSASSTKSTASGSQIETVTYNGSSNNYLETLAIQGYNFTKEFTKENTTYFVEINNDISSLTITATPEDSSATVCIYGNEGIQEGSKILISVTAENGNVRTYRVYVTK